MKKVFGLLIFLFSSLFLFTKPVFADDQFKTSVSALYSIDSTGRATIYDNITLENKTTEVYATSYTLVLQNITPSNPKASEGSVNLPVSVTTNQSETHLTVSFPDSVVGKSQSRNFIISFDETNVATKTGEVWEIYIPKLASAETFDSYNITLSVPKSFGGLAYVSPEANSTSEDNLNNFYSFSKDMLGSVGITAGFGEFQVFDFNLTYHLQNPLNKASFEEIAIPPDTSTQKIYYKSLTPLPESVSADNDGNWIAKYLLNPREQIEVKATGSVQIFSGSRPFLKPNKTLLNEYLSKQQYWEVDDPVVMALAANLKKPEAIYNYVSQNLKYNFQRVTPNVERLGAKKALLNPTNVICMEFTDLFITLARAAGIPAREIEGYAYTNDPQTEPLSLVADVLHAWPEYWDNMRNVWVPVDPTWGSTSGIDFFHKFDLRHFTFVTHGESSKLPFSPGSYKLGINPGKDVFVTFGKLPDKKESTLSISIVNMGSIPFFPQKYVVKIKNSGPTAYYNLKSDILFDSNLNSTRNISILPPFGTYNLEVIIPFSFFGNNNPNIVTVQSKDTKVSVNTSRSSEIQLSLIAFSFLIICLIIIVLYHLKGKAFRKIVATIYDKLFKKSNKTTS